MCVAEVQPQFAAVIGTVDLCEESLPVVMRSAASGD